MHNNQFIIFALSIIALIAIPGIILILPDYLDYLRKKQKLRYRYGKQNQSEERKQNHLKEIIIGILIAVISGLILYMIIGK